MLDQDMKTQLQQVFAALDRKVQLVYSQSTHADQADLVEMLSDVASLSPHLSAEQSSTHRNDHSPEFRVLSDGKPTGIVFKGIPSGHEFTTLILAILNSSHKGKMPDSHLQKRIQNIKGPIHLKTFISLTCENCPDVVQALNQISILHGEMTHEMIDGGYYQNEIDRLAIQGVPSLFVADKLVHSGRIQLIDLIALLEKNFGTKQTQNKVEETSIGKFDVLVIGGGPAGASAAIYSVRKGLKTALLTEKIGGQVQETRGIENLISVPYTEGPQLAGQLAKHVESYPIQVLENRRVKSVSKDSLKKVVLESGEWLEAESVIVATGAKWRELNIPGEKEYLGRGVAFCPHCDGPYYKGKTVAVVGGGNSGVEAAIDLSGIVKDVVLIEYNDQLKADQILVNKLKSISNIRVITNAKTEMIHGDGQKVTSVEYFDRAENTKKKLDLDGIFIQIGLIPNSQFLKDTIELNKFGEIVVDPKGRTSVPGIYAAGDVTTTPFKQIIIAMGEGAKAALAAFEDKMMHSA